MSWKIVLVGPVCHIKVLEIEWLINNMQVFLTDSDQDPNKVRSVEAYSGLQAAAFFW